MYHCSFTDFTTPELMWIDSLCINQIDTSEKNYQVRLMGDIFAKAQHVLIWLGRISASFQLARLKSELNASGHQLSDLIFATDPIAPRFDQDDNLLPEEKSVVFGNFNLRPVTSPPARAPDDMRQDLTLRAMIRHHVDNHDRENAIAELNLIYHSDYWSRIWTVQELVLAADTVDIVCGNSTISFDALYLLEQDFAGYITSLHRQAAIDDEKHP